MASILFYARDLKNGTMQVMARFSNGKDIKTAYSGYNLPSAMFGENYKHFVSGKARNHNNAGKINILIAKWNETFETYIEKCRASFTKPSMSEFKTSVLPNIEKWVKLKIDAPKLIDIANEYYNSVLGILSDGTTGQTLSLIDDLKEYEKSNLAIYLSSVNEDFYMSFVDFLIAKGNINSTIMRKITRIKTIMTFAHKKKYIATHDYIHKPKLKKSKSIKDALRAKELATLWAYIPEKNRERVVLDMFLLSCETGLRHSDIIQLSESHFKPVLGEMGIMQCIELSQEKTSKSIMVSLSNKAISIIDRYNNGEDKIFPQISSQKMSVKLKDICKHLKLTRMIEISRAKGSQTEKSNKRICDIISFHWGRTTFITRMNNAGMAITDVRDLAGHGNIETTMLYHKGNTGILENALKILNQ